MHVLGKKVVTQTFSNSRSITCWHTVDKQQSYLTLPCQTYSPNPKFLICAPMLHKTIAVSIAILNLMKDAQRLATNYDTNT